MFGVVCCVIQRSGARHTIACAVFVVPEHLQVYAAIRRSAANTNPTLNFWLCFSAGVLLQGLPGRGECLPFVAYGLASCSWQVVRSLCNRYGVCLADSAAQPALTAAKLPVLNRAGGQSLRLRQAGRHQLSLAELAIVAVSVASQGEVIFTTMGRLPFKPWLGPRAHQGGPAHRCQAGAYLTQSCRVAIGGSGWFGETFSRGCTCRGQRAPVRVFVISVMLRARLVWHARANASTYSWIKSCAGSKGSSTICPQSRLRCFGVGGTRASCVEHMVSMHSSALRVL